MKYKIDFIIGSLRSGGAERVVVNLANHLASKNHEIRIITFIDGDFYDLNPRINRIRFHKKRIIQQAIPRALFNLARFYKKKKNRPNVISSHIGLMGMATIPIAKLYKIKIIVSEHSNHLRFINNFSNRIVWDFLYPKVNAITILTRYDLEYFKQKNENVIVMENPCSFRPSKGLDKEKTILAVGNMNRYEEKGFDNLLKGLAKVLPENKEWKVKLVGGGDNGISTLKELVKDLKIEHFVTFTGFRNDVNFLMQKSEIFVLSSKYEGMPMALLEALSQEMACIAYDCVSGPSDIINSGENGILVENQNLDKLISNIVKVMKDDELRNNLGRNGFQNLKRYDISEVGDKWIKLIESI
ncbi:glycosyltransferase family 4 protein [Maribacter sp. R77961]|uniref:glycosyltransferase family 4 protein n=1 Tax=Maribacter sp. R77961 TaxID=3093871 RepID=UPI0037CA923A